MAERPRPRQPENRRGGQPSLKIDRARVIRAPRVRSISLNECKTC